MRIKATSQSPSGAFYLLLALMAWAPLPLASNRVWSSALLTILASALLIWVLVSHRRQAWRSAWFFSALSKTLLPMVLLWLYLGFQLLPLPAGFLTWLSPKAASFNQQLINPSSFVSIHTQVGAGRLMLVQSAGYIAVFISAAMLVNTYQRLRMFYYTIIASAVFQALYGVAMVLTGVNYLFFIKKWAMKTQATGTFVNSNHLAAYLCLGLAMAVGLLLWELAHEKPAPKLNSWRKKVRQGIALLLATSFRIRLLMVVMVIALVMTHSRMGNMAFLIALLATLGLYFYQTKQLSIKVLVFVASILVVDAFILGHWFGVSELAQSIERTSFKADSRHDIIISSQALMQNFWLVGSGLDSFDAILPVFMQVQSDVPFEHAHNDYLEFFVSLGVLGSLLLLWAVAAWLRYFFGKSQIHYGLLMAFIAIAVHSVADFNLFIPAFVFTLSACLATVYVREENNRSKV